MALPPGSALAVSRLNPIAEIFILARVVFRQLLLLNPLDCERILFILNLKPIAAIIIVTG